MDQRFEQLKGINPGRIIARELAKRGVSQQAFAASIEEHSQTLNAVITGRRKMPITMAVKIDKALDFAYGTLWMLQSDYELRELERAEKSRSVEGIPAVRRSLFWDTDFDRMDWGLYRQSVIRRVAERGNDAEKREIARYYGIPLSEVISAPQKTQR